MKTIEISQKNYADYKKIKNIMDELVMLDSISAQMPYDDFAKKANSIVKKIDANNFSFKEFIAHTNNDSDAIVKVHYEEYELLIAAKTAFRAIKILDRKSSKKMDWNSYGMAIDAIIEGYNQKEVV